MNTTCEEWIRRMADLEDGLPVSAGAPPFRQLDASCVDQATRRLQALAELEASLPVSAGGRPFRAIDPAQNGAPPTQEGAEDAPPSPARPDAAPSRTT